MKHSVPEEIRGVLIFLGVVWGVFLINLVLPYSLNSLGLTPRHLLGLSGVVTMPFLHSSWGHLLSNTIPLFVLLTLLAGSRTGTWEVVAGIVVLSGLLLWLIGRPGTHVGASALIFGLIVFLIASGLLEKRVMPLVIAILVGFLYGGTLLWGILPHFGEAVSFEGHLCGAVAGGVIAWTLQKRSQRNSNERPAGIA